MLFGDLHLGTRTFVNQNIRGPDKTKLRQAAYFYSYFFLLKRLQCAKKQENTAHIILTCVDV